MEGGLDQNKQTREIDILALAVSVLKEWKLLFIYCVVFGVLGIAYALCAKKTYTATVILAPETSSGSSKLGNLSGLASSLGADIGGLGGLSGSSDAITPSIYPNLFASLDFLLPLCDIPVMEMGADTLTTFERHVLEDKIDKFPDVPVPNHRKTLFKMLESQTAVDSKYYLTQRDKFMCAYLSKTIGCVSDKKTDIITISVTDGDPMVATILADTIQSRLQQYIIAYRTKKVKTDLDYYEMLLESARSEYEEARQQYASFAESHQGVSQKSYMLTEDYLENEMEQKYSIMTQVQMQVHSAKARVQEATPAFAIIQKPYIPQKASSMRRSQMVVLAGFLGLLAGVFWVIIGSNLYAMLRKKE